IETFADVFQQPKVVIYEYLEEEQTIQLRGQIGFKENELALRYSLKPTAITTPVLLDKTSDETNRDFAFLPFWQALVAGFTPRQSGTVYPGFIAAGFTDKEQYFMPDIHARLLPVFNSLAQKVGLHFEQQKILEKLKQEVQERLTYQQELEKIKLDLEQRVEDRTVDLAKNNRRLIQEIDERTEVELELRRSNAELEQFAYVASHDLKTPLRSIGSFAQLLYRRYSEDLDDAAKEYLNFILSSVQQLDNVINDLLRYSQINNQEVVDEDIDINELVKSLILQLKGTLDDNNATIQYGELPVLRCKKVQLEHLFHNLITNAVKFSKPSVDPKVSISFAEKDQWLVFKVRDNGIGISSKYKNKVFELFQRLHTDVSYEGTGLGLSICRKIVQNMGGEIWFEPHEEGTDFFFTVPNNYLR
ncbi:MAG: ATP-binding protein, partial [Bacteroidota bacterium]